MENKPVENKGEHCVTQTAITQNKEGNMNHKVKKYEN